MQRAGAPRQARRASAGHGTRRCRRRPDARPAASASTRVAVAAPPATRDASADVLQAVMGLALKKRLTSFGSVDTAATCDARGLLEGRFTAMAIRGTHWVTPLRMTAHEIAVEIGLMHVDLSVLLWERRVAMVNVPSGRVAITLSGKDLGNFMTHPLFQQAATTAVQGHAFDFDRDSVTISHARGDVTFTGRWAANGQRYRILMRPGGTDASGARRPLQVGAQRIEEQQQQQQPQQQQQQQQQQPQQQQQHPQQQQQQGSRSSSAGAGADDLRDSQAVASGMANFFTHMSLDLQGIEIRSPLLTLHPGRTSAAGEGDLLEIAMRLRLRALPPMDMQF